MSNPNDDVERVALLPCPFCGGEASLLNQKGPTGELYQWVECSACGATAGHCDVRSMQDDELHPIDAWNARAAIAALPGWRDIASRTRFYIDCEFDGHNGGLLSIALVKDDGDGIHIHSDIAPMDIWVRRNVLPLIDQHKAPKSAKVYESQVGDVIRAFIGDCVHPIIIADSPVDISRFCHALSTAPDGRWASADYPAMTFEVHNVDCYPTTLEGAVQHNAWWDAMALRAKLTLPTPPEPTT